METTTRIENNATDLTELECSIVEAQAVDRYKRYVKASRELEKMRIKYLEDDQGDGETTTYFDNQIDAIMQKHELPPIPLMFGEEVYECGPIVTRNRGQELQNIKHWIKSAAYGRMTTHQFSWWNLMSLESEIVDIYWLMTGTPNFYAHWDEYRDKVGYFDELEETVKTLCTRHPSKAKPLPCFGSSFWPSMYNMPYCGKIYPEPFQSFAHFCVEEIEEIETEIELEQDVEENKEKLKKLKNCIKENAKDDSRAKAYFKHLEIL